MCIKETTEKSTYFRQPCPRRKSSQSDKHGFANLALTQIACPLLVLQATQSRDDGGQGDECVHRNF